MLSKNKLKYIRALALKKKRDAEEVFVAEGPKVVGDLLPLLPCRLLLATRNYLDTHPEAKADEVVEITPHELEQASLLKAPRDVMAVFATPQPATFSPTLAQTELCLALDGVQDPGNLGTIIRVADWFGITHLLLSPDTADAFAPKVVQATMGAVGRVQLHKTDLATLFRTLPADVRIYGTFLDGENMYQKQLSANGIIVMGNEGNGISEEVAKWVNERLFIPSFPPDRPTSESLNVAIATAIVCAEFRR